MSHNYKAKTNVKCLKPACREDIKLDSSLTGLVTCPHVIKQNKGFHLKKGEEMGMFEMGSTIAMIMEVPA